MNRKTTVLMSQIVLVFLNTLVSKRSDRPSGLFTFIKLLVHILWTNKFAIINVSARCAEIVVFRLMRGKQSIRGVMEGTVGTPRCDSGMDFGFVGWNLSTINGVCGINGGEHNFFPLRTNGVRNSRGRANNYLRPRKNRGLNKWRRVCG